MSAVFLLLLGLGISWYTARTFAWAFLAGACVFIGWYTGIEKGRIMPVEFDCEGCGQRICNVSIYDKPKSGLCGMCAWLCEFMPDPEKMMRFRKERLLGEYNVLTLDRRPTLR